MGYQPGGGVGKVGEGSGSWLCRRFLRSGPSGGKGGKQMNRRVATRNWSGNAARTTRAMRETKQTKENLRQTMTEVKRAGETRNLFRSIYYKLYKATLEAWVVSRVLGAAYCWDTRGIVLGLWRAKGGESGMIGGEGG